MHRACLVALMAFAVISCVSASRILEDDAAATGRGLLEANRYVCSSWCAPDQCIRVGTTGLVKCNKCQNNMKPILSGVNAGQCGCPAGTYFDEGVNDGDCVPCEFGSYCFKQLTWIPNTQTGQYGKTSCGVAGYTTRARRSTSVWDCINAGGYYLTNTATRPVATACTDNTYAVAKSKQTACTPCPSGLVVVDPNAPTVVDPRDKATSCKVPPGYFLKSPGQIAPCDQGSYQDKYLGQAQAAVGSCMSCPEGVTTEDKGSTAESDCKRLKPGYVATAVSTGITTAVLCPQGWYCPGDVAAVGDAPTPVTITALHVTNGKLTDTTYISPIDFGAGSAVSAKITKCPNSAWTKTVGATQVDQCMVPPGFQIVGTDDISLCPDTSYRAEWISLVAAVTNKCVVCGDGIKADAIEPITLYSLDTGGAANTNFDVVAVNVQASSKSCYIVQGQGMYYTSSGGVMAYKARNCGNGDSNVANSYGVAGKVYGLAQNPCKLCPAGTKADTSLGATNAYKAANGFWNPLACVTRPGYGWDGRVATLCAKGWYNEGNNYKACTQCGYGLTTLTPTVDGAATDNSDDCLSAPGFGKYDNQMRMCPAGTYNKDIKTPDVCTSCNGVNADSWTEEEGSDAETDCTVCKPGFGGDDVADCNACGGDGNYGSYGPSGRDTTQCVQCPKSEVGFQFWYENVAKPYMPDPRAVAQAQDASECVAAMAQIEDGLWYLAGAEGDTATDADDIGDCATRCLNSPTCALATFNYAVSGTASCKILEITAGDGAVITAFKAVPSSDVSQNRRLQAAKPKAVSTGMYTQWKHTGAGIGVQSTPTDVADKAACFDLCDAQDNCAGVVYTVGTKKCSLITGVTDPAGGNAAKRSLTKAKPSLFNIA